MARNSFRLDFSAIAQGSRALDRFSPAALGRVQQRTLAAVKRRVPTEASRLISEQVLNVSTRTARQGMSAVVGKGALGGFVELRGSRRRLGLDVFRPRVSRSNGVTVTPWRDGYATHMPHAFRIKNSASKAIWQRIPYAVSNGGDGGGAFGLVHRLPIVVRKGPSLYRAVHDRNHGDIHPPLIAFARTLLATEVNRLLGVEAGR